MAVVGLARSNSEDMERHSRAYHPSIPDRMPNLPCAHNSRHWLQGHLSLLPARHDKPLGRKRNYQLVYLQIEYPTFEAGT